MTDESLEIIYFFKQILNMGTIAEMFLDHLLLLIATVSFLHLSVNVPLH